MLIFFDAHIEVTDGWLEPLLANIVADRSLVAIPHIDWISSSTMKFDATDYGLFSRYNWGLALYWYDHIFIGSGGKTFTIFFNIFHVYLV